MSTKVEIGYATFHAFGRQNITRIEKPCKPPAGDWKSISWVMREIQLMSNVLYIRTILDKFKFIHIRYNNTVGSEGFIPEFVYKINMAID